MLVSVSMAIVMIKVFQLLFFLLFINTSLPANASQFIYSFKKNILDYFPSFIKSGENSGTETGAGSTLRRVIQTVAGKVEEVAKDPCLPHKKFEENDQTCSSFVNLRSFISQTIIFLVIKIIVGLLIFYIYKRGSQTQKGAKLSSKKKPRNEGDRQGSNNHHHHHQHHHQDHQQRHQDHQHHHYSEADYYKKRNILGKKKNQMTSRNPPNHQQTDKTRANSNKNNVKKDSLIKKALYKIDTFLNIGYFFNLFKAMQLKAIIGILVSMSSTQKESLIDVANIMFSIIVITVYVAVLAYLCFLVFYKMRRVKSPDTTDANTQADNMFRDLNLQKEVKDLNKKNTALTIVHIVTFTQDLIVPFLLVEFVARPVAQILLIMLVIAITAVFIICYYPFREGHRSVLEIGNRIIYILILGAFLAGHLLKDKISDKQRFTYVGFGVIAFIVVLILFNVMVALWGAGKIVVKKCRERGKKGDKKANEVHPLEKEEDTDKDMNIGSTEYLDGEKQGNEDKSAKKPSLLDFVRSGRPQNKYERSRMLYKDEFRFGENNKTHRSKNKISFLSQAQESMRKKKIKSKSKRLKFGKNGKNKQSISIKSVNQYRNRNVIMDTEENDLVEN